MKWITGHPEMLGFLPGFLSENDPRPAREQFNERYVSGWLPFDGFTFDRESMSLNYPGDPPTHPVAMTTLRNETIVLFEHAWVMVLQDDGSFEIARMD